MKDKMPPKKKSTQPKKGDQVKQQVSDQDEEVKSQGSEAKHKTKEVEKQKLKDAKIEQNIQNQMREGNQESKIGQQQQKGPAQDQIMQLQQEQIQQIGQENQIQQIIMQDALEHPFADPTYDVTFKMLFGQKEHKDILISLLNNLLDFHGNKKIIDVEINNNELPVAYFFNKNESGIPSTVDVLCTIKENNQKIAVEMQGQRQAYFLNRTQEYMSKLISGQVKTGEGALYHKAVMDTYILIIGKQDLFTGATKLKDKNLFEIDVEPRIVQTNETFPGNKMHWKFYELPKFKESQNYKLINKDSLLKEQWLEFLIECSKQKQEPDRNDIIKKGYDIMSKAHWDYDTKVLYWKQRQNEIDALETQELLKQEEFNKGLEKGEMKGKIKGEINQVKFGIENEIAKDKIIQKLKFLPQDSYDYINQHMDDSASQVFQDHYQDLIGNINMDF